MEETRRFKGKCRTDRDCPHRKKCCEGTCRRECQLQGICQLPQKVGPCRMSVTNFFYNKHTGKCERFSYGGCSGNANNFKTLRECELHCLIPGICQLPQKVGPCRASVTNFFYNKHTGKCECFSYGGCGGNANNLKTLRECELRCLLPGQLILPQGEGLALGMAVLGSNSK